MSSALDSKAVDPARAWRVGLVVTGLAVLFGVLEAAQGLIQYHDVPARLFWPEALARTMPSWLVLAALCPALFWASRRWPLDGPRRGESVLAHAGIGVAFVIVHLGGSALAATLRHGGDPTFSHYLASFFYRYSVIDYFTYWAVIGVIHFRRLPRPSDAVAAPVASGDAIAPQTSAPAGEAETPIRRLVVKDRDRYLLLRDDEIAWLEAAGNYVNVQARGQAFLVRSALADLEKRLDPARFARIHRSRIVNTDVIQEIVPDGNGDFLVRVASGSTLKLSRSYRDRLIPRG